MARKTVRRAKLQIQRGDGTAMSMIVPFPRGVSGTWTTELADRTLVDLVFKPLTPEDLEKDPVPMIWDTIKVRVKGERCG